MNTPNMQPDLNLPVGRIGADPFDPGFARSAAHWLLVEEDWFSSGPTKVGVLVIDRFITIWNQQRRPAIAELMPAVMGSLREYAAEVASRFPLAEYHGADTGLAVASAVVMTERDADRLLAASSPEDAQAVTASYWKAESWLDDVVALAGADADSDHHIQALIKAFWKGRDQVWGDALRASALRLTGEVAQALCLERDLENRVDRLRAATVAPDQ